jgi:acetyl esterase
MANLDPIVQAYLDKVAATNPPLICTLSPQDARNALAAAQVGNYTLPPADIEDLTLPLSTLNGRDVAVRIVRPKGATETLPVVMYFHGGGWILGDTFTHDRLVREIAIGAHAAVVFVDYARAPEAQFPIAIEQGWGATRYVAEHASEFRVDKSRIALVGDSAGGNMAAVISGIAKQQGPAIVQQILLYPATDATFETESYREFADGPWLTRKAMHWFWDAYAPDPERRRSPAVSPLRAPLEAMRGLPPALIITAENDVLRDEGEAYAHKLSQAGVAVTAVRYLGTIHDFLMINAIAESTATRSAIALVTSTLRSAVTR